jgi:hypothetical protein
MSNPEFERWKMQDTPMGLRRGQHLMNTAPPHIYTYTVGVLGFDCFHEANPNAKSVQRFILFAELIWDERSAEQVDIARKMVRDVIPL